MYVYNFCFCRLYAQSQDLKIFKKLYMSQMNPKEFVHNTAYSVQLPYITGLSVSIMFDFALLYLGFTI